MFVFLVFFCSFLVPSILGQSCNSVEEIGATPFNISNKDVPDYPDYGEVACSWTTSTFKANQLKLMCNIKISSGMISGVAKTLTGGLVKICSGDYLEVSRTGRSDFADGIKYCGRDSFSVISVGNKMNIRYIWGQTNDDGIFSCTLQSFPNSCRCDHRKDNRIVGGTNAPVNQYPWMAGVMFFKNRDILCGATIISNRIALTAKSCINDRSKIDIGLIVSEYDILDGSDSKYTALYPIQNITCYNGCSKSIDPENNLNLALIITRINIEINMGVALACLPFAYQSKSFSGSKVELAGWGSTEIGGIGGIKATKLQEVQLDVISQTTCKRYYKNLTNNKEICTYTPGKSACDHDIGGGLLYTEPSNGRVYVIGVVKSGNCGKNSLPDMSTRVTSGLKWIEQNSLEFDFCKI